MLYILNNNTLDENVRKAIASTIDPEKMMAQLGSIMTTTESPFIDGLAYSKQSRFPLDADKAREYLVEAGYEEKDGIFEKDSQPLSVKICYYEGRSLDMIATLIQEQLKAIGIEAELQGFEKPEEYIDAGSFDIALLSMISDTQGDPQYFIDSTIKEGGIYNGGGYQDPEINAKIDELDVEPDTDRRAELANEIVQTVIDDASYGYLTHLYKTTVMSPSVENFAENNPFDFYGLNENTSK